MKKLVHGGDIYSALETYEGTILDFSANINPLGMPAKVREAAAQSLDQCSNYPDPLCRDLRKGLADKLNISGDHLIFGNGAADLIFRIVLAEKPKKALLLAPTFAEYEQALQAVDCNIAYYDLKEETGFQLQDDFLRELATTLDMVFLCNPNNPTGQLIRPELLQKILEKCRDREILLVVDECFIDFLAEPERHTLQRQLNQFPSLFLLRAFTKSHAMPGIRLGYGLCSDRDLLDRMFTCGQPWSVSLIAQQAGIAALEEEAFLLRSRELISAERFWLERELSQLGYKVYPAAANYIFFQIDQYDSFQNDLAAEGILVRSCQNYKGLTEKHFRIAVKTRSENQRLIQTLARREASWQNLL